MPLALTEREIRQSITMADAIAAIEEACREQAAGQALYAERVNMRVPNGWMRLMPAALLTSGVMGYKEFHLTQSVERPESLAHVRYAFHLFDYHRGHQLAMLDANYLTAIRTGAASGAATKYMAPPDARRVGVIGSGAEARSQLEAVAAVRPVEQVTVYSRSPERRERFAREMSALLGCAVVPVNQPERTIADADILIVATNTAGGGPALFGRWLRPGLHVISIGSTLPTQREIDPEVWSAADRIVVDTRRLLSESGDGIAAVEAGAVTPEAVIELQDVVAGKAAGRGSAAETTLYKSVGTALQDVAVAHRAYQAARARGLGRELPDFASVKDVEPN
jgi:ornithine cyclodeaminase/alanine dehydrogenase